jgi:hypothetical protein
MTFSKLSTSFNVFAMNPKGDACPELVKGLTMTKRENLPKSLS